ncbi:MAG: hypothetical protein M1608_09030 [Candidatus Omnitrophica bacterium]|nr:hypothetical protein [Candidatus Omnitrophota bacterium]
MTKSALNLISGWLVMAVVITTLTGCITTVSRVGELRLGMTQDDVVKVLGKPDSVNASPGVEVLHYKLYESLNDWFPVPYYVQLEDGRVTAYGRLGDYGTSLQAPPKP